MFGSIFLRLWISIVFLKFRFLCGFQIRSDVLSWRKPCVRPMRSSVSGQTAPLQVLTPRFPVYHLFFVIAFLILYIVYLFVKVIFQVLGLYICAFQELTYIHSLIMLLLNFIKCIWHAKDLAMHTLSHLILKGPWNVNIINLVYTYIHTHIYYCCFPPLLPSSKTP